MARAILIDPYELEVSATSVPDVWGDVRKKFHRAKLIRVATMPSGDAVYVAADAKDSLEGFRLGCSSRLSGRGLVVGARAQFGLLMDAVTDVEDVARLTKFCRS